MIELSCTHRVKTPCNSFFITVCYDRETKKLCRTFIDGKGLSPCQRAMLQTISRLVSLHLQEGTPKQHIIDELLNIRCNEIDAILPRGTHMSCPHAFGMLLRRVPWDWKEVSK